ncbi:MAG: nitroreductase family protein [Chloroflexota bacterium]
MTDYEALKKICSRRKSCRTFSDREVPMETLGLIREIAQTSPFASGRKTWDIIIINDKSKLAEIAEAVKNYAAGFSRKIKDDFRTGFLEYSKNFYFFGKAPAAFILTYRVTPTTSVTIDADAAAPGEIGMIKQWETENAAKSISCAATLVLLAAESLGLGACYTTGGLIAEEEILKHITNKKDRRIGAIIPVGYYN